MWYEVIPSSAVIGACIGLSYIFNYCTNRLLLNQPFRRSVFKNEDAYMVIRDSRVSNIDWAYKFVGLENIPDADNLNTCVK